MAFSFKSFLSTIATDAKKVFSWIGSPTGQAVIGAGENLAVAIDPALSGLVPLVNQWITNIVETETVAAAAASQSGTGIQKAAAVLANVTPVVLAYAKQAGLSTPTATEIANANTALVAFLNALNGTPAA